MISRICIAAEPNTKAARRREQARIRIAGVPELTPSQRQIRGRVEAVIAVFAPVLDAVLAVGDRISRTVEPEDHGYYPPRPLADEPPEPDQKTT
jgi:hypothetical protein